MPAAVRFFFRFNSSLSPLPCCWNVVQKRSYYAPTRKCLIPEWVVGSQYTVCPSPALSYNRSISTYEKCIIYSRLFITSFAIYSSWLRVVFCSSSMQPMCWPNEFVLGSTQNYPQSDLDRGDGDCAATTARRRWGWNNHGTDKFDEPLSRNVGFFALFWLFYFKMLWCNLPDIPARRTWWEGGIVLHCLRNITTLFCSNNNNNSLQEIKELK